MTVRPVVNVAGMPLCATCGAVIHIGNRCAKCIADTARANAAAPLVPDRCPICGRYSCAGRCRATGLPDAAGNPAGEKA